MHSPAPFFGFVLIIASTLAAATARAQEPDPSDSIIPHTSKLLKQEQRNQEIQDFKAWQRDREEESTTRNNPPEAPGVNCITIEKIRLEGNTLLSEEAIGSIASRYENTCITTQKIAEIVRAFSKAYQDRGYITTLAYVKEQNLSGGVLTLSVLEGKVESVTFGDDSTADKITGYFASPVSKGDILNLRALDQTTENLGYLPSYAYKTTLEPGLTPGTSRITIQGKRSFPVSPYAETDTLGQAYTGHERYTLGVRLDNPLKLADSLNLKYTSTFHKERDGMYSRSYSGSWSMPIKWARIGLDSSYSTYLSTIRGQLQSFRSTGNMSANTFFVNGVIFRSQRLKTTLTSSLSTLSSRSYIEDTLSDVQSRNLSTLELGLMNNLYTPYGGFFHKLTYVRGLKAFGAKKDPKDATYHGQFEAIRFYQLYNLKTDRIFQGRLPFTFQNTIDSQYAFQDVYSQDQFVLGGFYSIRGFRDVNLYGSSGILTRSDLDFSLVDYLTPSNTLKRILTDNGRGGLSIGAFFDLGGIASHSKDASTNSGTGAGNLSSGNHGTLSGAGVKLGYTSRYLQSDLELAHALHYPEGLKQDVKKEGWVVYFTLRGIWE